MEEITKHFSPTLDVLKLRLTGDIIDRIQVAKLLLIKEFGIIKQFLNKSLEDIEMKGTTRLQFLYLGISFKY